MKGNLLAWHDPGVRPILGVLFLCATSACADEVADRAAIEHVIAALNESRKPPAILFTANADVSTELERLSSLDRGRLRASNQPWSEVTKPQIVTRSIRFITSDVALVDTANTQYGSLILVRSIPVLFVLKKEGTDWRISSLRVMVDCRALANPDR